MTDAWHRCRGHNDGVLAPLDLVDNIYLWAAGEAAIAAQAVAALCNPVLDIPVVVGSSAQVPAWVGGATLCIIVDRQGDGAGGGLVDQLIGRGGPVIGLTADTALAQVLSDVDATVLDVPDEAAVLPPLVVPLLEALDLEDLVDDLAGWSVPRGWTGGEGLPAQLATVATTAGVPAVYGSHGIGAVAATWMAAQLRLFTGRPAVGDSFGAALTHLPAWGASSPLTPMAWLVADDAEAAVAEAFDAAVPGVTTVRCRADGPAARLAELLSLTDLVLGHM
ncbi:MAG TPA: hypothetical protein VMM13_12040 [Euzebya sp.]|nr:hypothetical protein [Euzebya sp.]